MFSKRSNLKAHMRVHSGVLPYPCEFPGCTKRFRWKSSLKPHVKVHLASMDPMHSSPCSSANYSSGKKCDGILFPTQFEENSQAEKYHQPSFPEISNGSRSLNAMIIKESPQSIVPATRLDLGSSPSAIAISELPVGPRPLDVGENSSPLYHCTFPSCGESFGRISYLLDHESFMGHRGSRLQVARVLFQDATDQDQNMNEGEIDLTCNSVLSESQVSDDVLSFTLDSRQEDVPNTSEPPSITADLWKGDIGINDPFAGISSGIETESSAIDMLSAEECTAQVPTSIPEYVPLTEQHWLTPLSGGTTSTSDFTASLYL